MAINHSKRKIESVFAAKASVADDKGARKILKPKSATVSN